jgi:hypothetical protein
MGAAASTEPEKEELRKVYAVFANVGGSKNVSSTAFEVMVKDHAPQIWQKLSTSGDSENALLALQSQLEGARLKLSGQSASVSENQEEAPPLSYEWAKDAVVNLQKGLAAGLLSPVPLPRVRFVIGEGELTEDTPRSEPLITVSATTTTSQLGIGSHARVKDVIGQPQTNNLEVVIEDWDSAKQRYLVKFVKSQKLALLKPENLSLVQLGSPIAPTYEITALVDSGAEHSALSPSMAKRSGVAHLIDSKFAGNIGGVGTTNGYGRIHYAKIHFRNSIEGEKVRPPLFELGFDVFEWPPSAIEFDAILGIDFLKRYKATIDVANSVLVLNRTEDTKTVIIPFV